MERINEAPINVPVKKAPSDKKFIKGTRYGTGDTAIIFSNMDTNDTNEWNSAVEEFVSNGIIGLTYTCSRHSDVQSGFLEDLISSVSDLGAEKIFLVGASRGVSLL